MFWLKIPRQMLDKMKAGLHPAGHSPTNCCLLIVFQSIFGRIFFANMK